MPPKQQAPVGQHSPGLFIALGIGLGAAATYLGLPGMLLVLAGLITAAFQHPGFIPTGPKDKTTQQPTPLDHEKPLMSSYRYWTALKNSLIIPGRAWMPGIDVQQSFLVALWAAALAWHIPTPGTKHLESLTPYVLEYGSWVNALCAFIIIAPTTHLARQYASLEDASPGAPLSALIKMAKSAPQKTIGLSVASLMLALMLASVLSVLVNLFMPVPEVTVWALTLTGAFLLVVGPAWRKSSLDHWKKVVAARKEWEPYWDYDKKIDSKPRLVDVTEIGPATIHTYKTEHPNTVDTLFANFEAIKAPIDHNLKVAMIDVPLQDEQGQDMPGSVNQREFKVVIWPPNSTPDWEDPKLDEEIARLYASCCYSWTVSHAPGRPEIEEMQLVSAEGSPAIWAMTWYPRTSGDPTGMRQAKDMLMGGFEAEVLVDHRANGGAGIMYVGALSQGEENPDKWGRNQTLAEISEEDSFNGSFEEAMAQGTNAPVPNFRPRVVAKLVNGTQVDSLPFVMRRSQTWELYLKIEQKLGTVMSGSTMCTMVGYPKDNGRPGDRRPDAFSLLYSYGPIPARPHELQPNPEEGNKAEKMVLQYLINQAFLATKRLPRPEIHTVSCLTTTPEQEAPAGRGRMRGRRGAVRRRRASHIWRIDMRLYDGVTLTDVRSMAAKIQETLGSPWLRIKEAPDGCSIVVGSDPADVTFVSEREEEECLKLNWQHAWHSAKIVGNGGRVPQLVSVNYMEDNDLVSIIEFALPPPLDFGSVKSVDKKLGAMTGNDFVQVKRIPGNPAGVQVLCATESPIPSMAPYDWEFIKAEVAKRPSAPFATSMSGAMVQYDPKRDVHLMVVGGSGSGKSVAMQSLVTGALASGADVYIGDPTKGANDFLFMEQYAKAFAVTMIDTSAMMRGVYEEVKNRVALLAKYKVGNIKDLPPEVRPRFVYVILDEFTGLVSTDKVPARIDDPEAMAEREEVVFNNMLKNDVGQMTGKIAREARAAGVTLILATQKLDAATLAPVPGGTTMKANMSRLIVGSTSLGDLQAALKNPYNAPDMDGDVPKGRGLFESAGASEPEMIQCYYEPGEQEKLAEYVAEVRSPLTEDERLDLRPFRRIDPNAETIEGEFEEEDSEPVVIDLGDAGLDFDDLDFGEDDFDDDEGDGDAGGDPPEYAPRPEPAPHQPAHPGPSEPMPGPVTIDPVSDIKDPAVELEQPVPPVLSAAPEAATVPALKPFREPAPAPATPVAPASKGSLSNTLLLVGDTGPYNDHCKAIQEMGMPVLAATGATVSSDGQTWEQLDNLVAWLEANPAIRNVVWIDKAFNATFDAGVLANRIFKAKGMRLLSLGPVSSGVTAKMVAKVQAFNTPPPADW